MEPASDAKYWIGCVDDDQAFLESAGQLITRALSRDTAAVSCDVELALGAAQFDEAAQEMAAEGAELALLITDQIMPDCSGLELIERVKKDHPATSFVLLTGYAGLESARYAINNQLLDRYVCKPIEDEKDFAQVVMSEFERFHLRRTEAIQAAQIQRQAGALRLANERLERMKKIAENVAYFSRELRTLDLDEVLDLVCSKAPQLFGAKSCLLFVPDADNELTLWRERRVGCLAHVPPGVDINKAIREALATRKPAVATERDWCLGAASDAANRQGCVVMPLWLSREEATLAERSARVDPGSEVPALLCLCDIENPENLARHILEYKVLLISDILGANIANALAHSETDRLAHEDSLTGAKTRRVFDSAIAAEWERFERYESPFCVALIDVDHLKHINDTHGHVAGDEVLRKIADIAERQSRRCDTIARYGGDEFGLILPETDIDGALAVLERIQEAVDETVFSFAPASGAADGPAVARSTVSVGVACSIGKGFGAELVAAADRALYECKQTGRDRICTGAGV
ncbi:MAG: diguanylate cyclase [Planctomycetota bacterium]